MAYRCGEEDGIEHAFGRCGRASHLRVIGNHVSNSLVGHHPESSAGKPVAVKVARPVWSGGKTEKSYLSLQCQEGSRIS